MMRKDTGWRADVGARYFNGLIALRSRTLRQRLGSWTQVGPKPPAGIGHWRWGLSRRRVWCRTRSSVALSKRQPQRLVRAARWPCQAGFAAAWPLLTTPQHA